MIVSLGAHTQRGEDLEDITQVKHQEEARNMASQQVTARKQQGNLILS